MTDAIPEGTSAQPPPKGMADTPDALADTLVRALDPANAGTWLDPSAGSGQLIEAALRFGVAATSVLAIDLQSRLPKLSNLGVELHLGTDFLQWAQRSERRFDRVMANPPYVRISELDHALSRPALETRFNGYCVPSAANYWAAFLVAGMRMLKQGGSLAFVLPAAWEYADYASRLRDLCEASFEELEVHRVSVPMFESVSDGSVLLIGRGFGRHPKRRAKVFKHNSLADLSIAVRSSNPQVESSGMRQLGPIPPENYVEFGDVAQIRVGAVTGDVSYFLLNEERRIELTLPRSSVKPVLSKAQHIVGSEIDEAAWQELLVAGKRVWLFRPKDADLLDPAVRAYLDLPSDEGGCNREAAKVQGRDPWHRVPITKGFHGFISGLSPNRPWVALNRMHGLTVTNTLYGVSFRDVESVEEMAAWCLSMLSTATAESRALAVRQYPQGLLKLEPGDIARLVVRRPSTAEGARRNYKQAIEHIVNGDPIAARALADEWLGV
ncbi:MAG: hypothetical protein OXP37_00295 [Chloroflexota bacterium]|nr:hypothetical protein [Chloroflexota bacterium]